MGADKSLLLACTEDKVDDDGVESLFWDEKSETCHKITTIKFDYYNPSDEGLTNRLFTLGGDEELKNATPNECCQATANENGANKSLLLACTEVKVDEGSVESLFWDEKSETCHKITTVKFEYYLPNDE